MLNIIEMQRIYFKELEKETKEKLELERVNVNNFYLKHDLNTRYSNQIHTYMVYNLIFTTKDDTLYELEIKRTFDFINDDEEGYKSDLIRSLQNIIDTKVSDNSDIRIITIED